MGVGNGILRSVIGSAYGDPGGKPPPKSIRSHPPGFYEPLSNETLTIADNFLHLNTLKSTLVYGNLIN